MELRDMLSAVRNDKVEFLTMSPPGSPFAILERRVVVTAPPELVELSQMGDVSVLDSLVKMLKEPDRAWAAMVLLAAMTREEEKMVDVYATSPAEWWDSIGKTAHERWRKWLKEKKRKLAWDDGDKVFVEKEH